jgi:hypothetical protein
MNDDGVGRREEKRKERNPFYLSLCYFDAIFELKLNCQLGIGCYKSWVLQLIHIEIKFFCLTLLFKY